MRLITILTCLLTATTTIRRLDATINFKSILSTAFGALDTNARSYLKRMEAYYAKMGPIRFASEVRDKNVRFDLQHKHKYKYSKHMPESVRQNFPKQFRNGTKRARENKWILFVEFDELTPKLEKLSNESDVLLRDTKDLIEKYKNFKLLKNAQKSLVDGKKTLIQMSASIEKKKKAASGFEKGEDDSETIGASRNPVGTKKSQTPRTTSASKGPNIVRRRRVRRRRASRKSQINGTQTNGKKTTAGGGGGKESSNT